MTLPNGQQPPFASALGWTQKRSESRESSVVQWCAQGEKVGWVDGDFIYLEPEASYRAADLMAGTGEGLTITSLALRKRLADMGLLIREVGRSDELLVRRTVEGASRRVLSLRRDFLFRPPPTAVSLLNAANQPALNTNNATFTAADPGGAA